MSTQSVAMSPALIVREKILTLQQQLLDANPRMPGLLQEIHNNLREDPEIVTLLPEPEIIAIVVAGLKKVTATEITAAAIKGAGKKKTVGLDDI